MERNKLYTSLSPTEFRVIHLLPGAFHAPIRCILETRPASIKTRYEALSYQWGDDTITKPIHIARLDSDSPSQPHPQTQPISSPWPISQFMALIPTLYRRAQKYHIKTLLHILSHALGTALIYALVRFLRLEAPPWVPWFIPSKLYLFLLSALCGGAPLGVVVSAWKLGVEVVRMKPWRLWYTYYDPRLRRLLAKEVGKGSGMEFETVPVTTNLEMALRYLRSEKRVRTVWVDAVCINQADEEEKRAQVQRMDLIYANASGVTVWLGGYHGIGGAQSTEVGECEEGGECEHRQRIREAFELIWRLSGWRLLGGFYFARHKKERIRRARPGLREVYQRGWWERLWVVQEVALATGPVRIQCGYESCAFDEFRSAQHPVLWESRGVKEMEDESTPAERLGMVVKQFRYSSFYDREDRSAKVLYAGIRKIMGFMFRDGEEKEAEFHQQPFAGRLQRILLRTAGHFQCRDDRDRLYAVLGIAGGAKTGDVTQMADFVRYISSFSTGTILGHSMDPIFKACPDNLWLKLAGYAFGFAHGTWASFYDSRAKHWTINRPEYIIAGYKGVVDAVTGGPGANPPSRVEFFTALARYLADQTKTLSFLDAANCGGDKDKDGGMPSWVPNWTREVSSQAYDFASQAKRGLARDTFGFREDGKALWLHGRRRGVVHVVRAAAETAPPFQRLLESWLALPAEGKEVIVSAVGIIATVIRENPEGSGLDETRLKLISVFFGIIKTSLDLGDSILKLGGTMLVYSFDKAAGEMGFLRAGEAVKGDSVVFVPGCFHHLVLRRQGEGKTTGSWWKLVGLVAMGTDKLQKAGCSKEEWAQFRKDGTVFKYNIM
ncbi:heterokaryon incompatibility protein-domain-containing protein [Parachaetomium inaequale]|uniref:Heterokaryon incompatibility protein-domain-containing protein n=1 Tax=Parachaetomium inaequale TaxID=2588326 RepID=A0AAN6SRA4_9PEZI|nr:heterokaryon incompatibility protein-domain-containing protein [Parachaetomium inaequale]